MFESGFFIKGDIRREIRLCRELEEYTQDKTLIYAFITIPYDEENPVLRAINAAFVAVIRGTPLLVQGFFIYFGITGLLQIRISAFAAGVIALSLNAGGYLSEIFRGGIQAVDPGQREAARSLGLSARQTTWRIIIPQAVRICIPSVVNQWCITIKDTSIISVIGLAELTKVGQQIIARTYRSFEVWIIVGLMYLVVIYLLTLLARIVEKKVSLSD